MIKRLATIVLSLVAPVVLFTAVTASAGTAEFDHDPDVHAQLNIEVIGEGLVTGTPGENGSPSCGDGPGFGCHVVYLKGSIANLQATPDPGWILGGWTGCLHETGATCQVFLTEQEGTYDNVDVRAAFTKFDPSPSLQPLTLSVAGPGHVAGPEIACPSDCSQSYIAGAVVTLQAQPDPLASFTGWSAACSGGPTSACVVKMDAAGDVTATFVPDIPIGTSRTLSVEVTGTGSGSVSAGAAIACPGDCTQSYIVAADVTLTTTPAANAVFEGWSGARVRGPHQPAN